LYANEKADITRYESTVKSITQFLERLEYTAFRVRKDRHGRFHELEPIVAFPVRVWTPENESECDYLLLPREKLAIRQTLMEGRGG
jgi:hypothetical protein